MKITLLALITLFVASSSISQDIGDRTIDRATRKANNRIDTRIDQGLDKGLGAIEGLFKKKTKDTDQDDVVLTPQESEESTTIGSDPQHPSNDQGRSDGGYDGGQLGSMLSPAVIESDYSFEVDLDILSTTTKKNGKSESTQMTMYFSDDAMAFRADVEDKGSDLGLMIFDKKNGSTVVLTEEDGQKGGIAMNMPKQQLEKLTTELQPDQSTASITATGNTKTILGKKCSEYQVKDLDNHSEGTFWMTTEIDYDIMSGLVGMIGQNVKASMPENYPQGFMMEAYGTDTKNGERYEWKVTRLAEDSSDSFDMGAWNVKDIMGGAY